MALAGIIAYFINYSTEQTNKVSFKAAGVKYKQHFVVSELSSLADTPADKKQTPEQKVQEILKNFFQALKHQNSTNSSFSRVIKQPIVKETTEISSDLQVFSSFDCVKSIPTVLLDYISNTFLDEYARSHTDFHFQYRLDETLPLLKNLNINCDIDQNCSTSFQYDKQYGLNTTGDNTYQRKELFYCCPSVHISKDEPISNICKRAQTLTGKSIFRESKDSAFMERVNELSTHALL